MSIFIGLLLILVIGVPMIAGRISGRRKAAGGH
jgi:hypothetical protein